jgi:hypothetical protein
MLLVGPPMPDGSKAIGQNKRDTYPGPPGWGLGHEADSLIPVKKNIPLGNLG